MVKICRCGSSTVEKKIKIERTISDRRITFKNVPVSVCPNCNEQYLSAKALKEMDRLLEKNREASEISFEIDPKEQNMVIIIKKMLEQNVIPVGHSLDMPATISDVVFALDRLTSLRFEQISTH